MHVICITLELLASGKSETCVRMPLGCNTAGAKLPAPSANVSQRGSQRWKGLVPGAQLVREPQGAAAGAIGDVEGQ